MDFTIVLIGLLFLYVLSMIVSDSKPLVLTIKSRAKGNEYIVIKKSGRSGYNVSDWDYYDDEGKKITNNDLKNIIHQEFKNEDWFGDFPLYVNDVNYYQAESRAKRKITKEEEVK